MPYIISTTIDYIYHLWFQYMLNYPIISSLSEREREGGREGEREGEREREGRGERERGSGSKHAMNCAVLAR